MDYHSEEVEGVDDACHNEQNELVVPHEHNPVQYVVVVDQEGQRPSLYQPKHRVQQPNEIGVAVLQLGNAARDKDNTAQDGEGDREG